MGDEARKKVRGHPVSYYFDKMDSVREKTLAQFRDYNDEWL